MDRPILFSGPMVRALLEGRKTQTRRIINPQPHSHMPGMWRWKGSTGGKGELFTQASTEGMADSLRVHVVKYDVGDRLWVRESCRAEELSRPPTKRATTTKERHAAFGRTHVTTFDDLDCADGVRYLADSDWIKIDNTPAAGDAWCELFHYRGRGQNGVGHPVPPIHMPRWASRLTLTVTDVRVQRLQEISEEDAKAEGLPHDPPGRPSDVQFLGLWDSLNADRGFGWETNPWVVALTFTVEKRNLAESSHV